MGKAIFSRQELYDLVWTEPLIRLSRKYNLSDNGLRKMCKKMNIPLPDNGYWQKIKYNKPVERKRLPKDESVSKEINLIGREKENLINTKAIRVKTILKSYESLDKSLFRVPARLSNPDKLIVAAQKELSSKKPSEYNNWLVNTYSGVINIKVAPANISRALRFLDTVIKFLYFRGYNVIPDGRETYALIEGERIDIALREKLRVEKTEGNYSWNTYKYFPTGRLIFRMGRYSPIKEFIDGEKSLEERLPLILAELEYRRQKEKEERIEREIYWAKEEEKLRIEQERKARKDKEMKDFKNLLKESKSWHKSVILDSYIKEVERKAIENNNLTDELQTWLYWAKQKAEWFNPFIKKEDEFLLQSDRLIF